MAAGCQSATFFLANVPNAFGSYHRTRDLPYGSDPRQRLDAYSPTGAIDRPIVIFWYGGSWQMGTKSQYAFVGAALARQGYVVFLPDYRLYPQVRFPLFVEDGASAVAWVQRRAREFGGDPARIVLMGHSAGAYMAAFLALNDAALAKAGADTHSILGLVGLSGPYALEPNTEALRTIFGSPYLPVDWQPVQFVSDHSPPTLLIQGLADQVVAPSHTTRLRDALQAHHVRVETELYPGKGHADSVAPFAVLARFRSPAQSQTVRFIESVTGKSAASR
jgi:acetyl esterase/lipase